jgi:DNA-binding response OmpR family regulator
VLVVDDEADLRELLQDALSSDDLTVSTAASGSEAVEMASRQRPDIVVTDLRLGDCSGMDVIDRVRTVAGYVPAVVITGHGDPALLSEATRCRPIELMTKPLDLPRLLSLLHRELDRREDDERSRVRTRRLRSLARRSNIERRKANEQLQGACADLSEAYRTLSGQLSLQQVVIGYQRQLLSTRSDDDVFRGMFSAFLTRSGPVFGVAMVCDADAKLQMAGRFGVPYPDNATFCRELIRPLVDVAMGDPRCMVLDATEKLEMFGEPIRRFLTGVSALLVPLIPSEGEMIGLVVLYRKGEQPFTDDDLALAEMISAPTALSIMRNE